MLFSLVATILLFYFLCKCPEKCILLVFIWYPTITLLPICRGINVSTLFIYLCFFYTLYSRTWDELKKFPFFLPFILCIGSYVVSAILGYKIALSVAKWVEQYILVLTVWMLFKPKHNIISFLINNLMLYLCVLVIYSVFESITFSNPFLDYLRMNGVGIPKQGEGYVRYGLYRSQSMTIWTSILAIACGIGAVLLAKLYFMKYVKHKLFFFITICCCLVGVFISGTRSAMLVTFIAAFCLFKEIFNARVLLVLGVFCCVFIYFNVEYFSAILDSFLNPEDVGGSSLEQRSLQFLVTYKYWMQAPFIGNGLDYTNLLVEQDVGILGAESIIFRLLIDRGILGFISYFFLYIYAIVILYKRNLFFLSFILIGFMIGKVMSLLPSIEEAYVFVYLVLLLRIIDSENIKILLKNIFINKLVKRNNESIVV